LYGDHEEAEMRRGGEEKEAAKRREDGEKYR